jgi:hypothetical protein
MNADCGGSPTSNSNGGGGTACTVTLSGAVTSQYDCSAPAVGSYASGKNQGAIGVSVNPATNGQPPTIEIAVAFPGQLSSGEHANTDAGAKGGATLQVGTQFWAAVVGSTSDQGSYSLTISSTGTAVTAANGDKAYLGVHGTLDATMPPVAGSGSTGNVTLHAEF